MSTVNYSYSDVEVINGKINSFLEPLGMESYPFLLDWYNSKVHKAFQFPYDKNTVAFTLISTPSMFEKAFIPFLASECIDRYNDPLDQCMRNVLSKLTSVMTDLNIEIIYDYELTPSRRPKVLMQTAGHVSGAARFYQRSDIGEEDPWPKDKRIYGVSIHPTYGGWFAFRAVVILRNCTCETMKESEPEMVINEKEDLVKLLTLFNDNWKDGRFRDIIKTSYKYSEVQRKYFDTLPALRHEIIESILKSSVQSVSS